jgi:hypothetical protein
MAADRINLVGALVQDGRPDEAGRSLSEIARDTVALGDIELTVNVLELFATIFAELGDRVRAAHLLGASAALRQRAELPLPAADAALIERSIASIRPADRHAWDRDVAAGAGYTVDEALEEAESRSAAARQ